MFLTLHKWYRSDDLLKLTAFAAMAREEREFEKLSVVAEELRARGGEIYLLRREPMIVSSTDFRTNRDPSILDEAVFAYIVENNLYGFSVKGTVDRI